MSRKFNGTSDKVVSAAINLTSNFTIFIRYRNDSTPTTGIRQPFAWNSTADHGINFSWDHNTDAFRQAWAIHNGSWFSIKYTTSLQANTWYDMAFTFDGSTFICYLDGVNEAQVSTGTPTDEGTELISVGTGAGGTNRYDDGTIAEAVVWNTALTVGELKSLSAGISPSRIRNDNLILYWPLYGNASPEPDFSGNGYSGTVSGTTQADHPPITPPFGFDMGWMGAYTTPAGGGDPEGSLIGGKLIRGGLLKHGVLVGR